VPRKNALLVWYLFLPWRWKYVSPKPRKIATSLHDALVRGHCRQNLKYGRVTAVNSKSVKRCGKKPCVPLLSWQMYTPSMKAYEECSWPRHWMEAGGELRAATHSS
jgi:hypothetical protein